MADSFVPKQADPELTFIYENDNSKTATFNLPIEVSDTGEEITLSADYISALRTFTLGSNQAIGIDSAVMEDNTSADLLGVYSIGRKVLFSRPSNQL